MGACLEENEVNQSPPSSAEFKMSGVIPHSKCFMACTMITLVLFFQVEVVSVFSVACLFLATLKL
jgi:hypothetical protein